MEEGVEDLPFGVPGVPIRRDDAVAHVALHYVVHGTLVDVHLRGEDLLDVRRAHHHKQGHDTQPESAQATVLLVTARHLFDDCVGGGFNSGHSTLNKIKFILLLTRVLPDNVKVANDRICLGTRYTDGQQDLPIIPDQIRVHGQEEDHQEIHPQEHGESFSGSLGVTDINLI